MRAVELNCSERNIERGREARDGCEAEVFMYPPLYHMEGFTGKAGHLVPRFANCHPCDEGGRRGAARAICLVTFLTDRVKMEHRYFLSDYLG